MATPKRILIYRLGSLGDTVVALPSFHLLARMYPQAERRVLTNFPVHEKAPRLASILEGSGLVHGYLRYTVGLRRFRDLWQLRREIRKYRADLLVYLTAPRGIKAAKRDRLFFRLCGIWNIVGLPDTEDLQNCRRIGSAPCYVRPEPARAGLPPDIGLPVEQLLEPEALRLARCLAPLGDSAPERFENWDLRLTNSEHRAAADALSASSSKILLAVALGTKVQAKDWGLENWQLLLSLLAQRLPNHHLVLLGAAQEAEESAAAASAWSGRATNLCGRVSPRESAAVLSRAQLLLSLDSGPMHLAASVGTPVVAIFAARNRPAHWFPFGEKHRVVYHRTNCWGCGLETCIEQQKKCLLSITVEEVLAAVEKSLAALGV